MERPALQRLLADIGEGLIDVVVVYKVDRLTRSLADFAKMVEVFDTRGVSFVAVTQQFNTTTSMGRLTLNVLLSFAQFEREVYRREDPRQDRCIEEEGDVDGRCASAGVRHQGAAAKRSGTSMNDTWSSAAFGSSGRELNKQGIVSKVRVSKKGNKSGGCHFSRGALYELLANPIYVGEIRHKQERHPGLHEPILVRELWERVQQRLGENAARGGTASTKSISSPLAGRIFDTDGEPLYAQGAAKAGRRYRYYVSRSLVNGSANEGGKGWRLAAPEIERAVAIAGRQILNDRTKLLEALEKSGIDSPDVRGTLESTSILSRRMENQTEVAACMVELIDRVELREDGISVTLNIQVPCSRGGVRTINILCLSRFVPLRMQRRGVETRIIITAGGDLPRKVDPALLKAVSRARVWFDEFASGRVRSLAEIARHEGIAKRYVERLSRLAFVAPAIVEAICQGRQPTELNAETLLNRIDLPLEWPAQLKALGVN